MNRETQKHLDALLAHKLRVSLFPRMVGDVASIMHTYLGARVIDRARTQRKREDNE